LGLGFTVLLKLMNRIYLKTNELGTTLVLEQKLDSGIQNSKYNIVDNAS